MSEPRLVSPMLDGFALGGAISDHNGIRCYPAMRQDSDERYIVKTISVPASQVELDALLLTGAYPSAGAAKNYFKSIAAGIRSEIKVLEQLAAQRGFLPYLSHQIVPMEDGVGYEIYLLSPYQRTLERHLRHEQLTHLSAVNMGIDLCAALAVCRESGYLYVDLKPENIVLSGEQNYHIADLGFVPLDALSYTALPQHCRSPYTAPEVCDALSSLNTTMDTYALGLILYGLYNEGQLPEDLTGTISAPKFADGDLAEILLQAIAPDPQLRFASPIEMGKALIRYMQSHTVNDTPIGQPEEPELSEPEEAPQSDGEAADEESEATEVSEAADEAAEPAEEEVPAEDTDEASSEEATEEQTEEAPSGDWIDAMDHILSEDADGEAPDGPSLRELLQDRAYQPEDGEEPALSEEAADMLSQAQELIEHEAPQPVVAPEPIEIPMPDPIILEPDTPDKEEEAFEALENPQSEDADAPEEVPEDEAPAQPEKKPKKPGRGKKILKVIVTVLLVAALICGGCYYYEEIYRQTIDGFTVSGEADTMVVQVDTKADPSLLTVVCKDTYGNIQTAKLTDGTARFSQLKPASQYTVSLEIAGFHELVGAVPATYSTPARSQILNLSAITGAENGSVILNFAVEGPDSEQWHLNCTSSQGDAQELTFSGHTVTVNDLTIGETYTFTLSGGEEIYLIGENTVEYTVRDVVLAQNVRISSYVDTNLTAVWEQPEGIEVGSWTAHCYNEEGYDQVIQVAEPTVTFENIDPESGYTLEVTAQGMTQSQRIFVTANPINILSLQQEVTDTAISLSWDFDGKTPENGWLILYTVDGGSEQLSMATSEPSATISPVAPGSHYVFSIATPDSTSIFGGTGEAAIPASEKTFSGHGLNAEKIRPSFYPAPDKENWSRYDLSDSQPTSSFAPGTDLAVVFYTGSIYQLSDSPITTLMVIRDAEQRLAAIDSSTRTWDDMWDKGYCEVEFHKLPALPGEYTLDIFFNGAKVASKPLTITP